MDICMQEQQCRLMFAWTAGVVDGLQELRNENIQAEVDKSGVPARRDRTCDQQDEQYMDNSDDAAEFHGSAADAEAAAYASQESDGEVYLLYSAAISIVFIYCDQ